ncbi:MAG: methyl-accepting chemotaxis protein [Gammaproteobacteria bacterium HGW-Gammaproteobacteria-13]|uniref:methyl-accepting chemotaxis protein n=1 Tax=Pseudomonas sp. 1928-m TaxID=3033804 RepID=UPI000CCA6A96|nr:methyl-accepting chemotaxis protein [Pseudomonas sp. 1928-m]MDF3195843.1 methyl-accepting chemotaxis protein [Pseudomonas sp. 1928-m]PKM26023.1 MAG: methyl-accepting chemotaxis protein [Gammaproteobacteria bacterium HGW-Gammaproteobacteria-13]
MKNWKIRTHLFLLSGCLLFGLLCVGGLGLYGLQATVKGLQTVYLDRVVPLRDLKLIADLYAVNIVDATHKARSGELDEKTAQQLIEQAQVRIEETWQAYLATELIREESQLIEQINPLMEQARQPLNELQSLLNRGDKAGIDAFASQRLYPLIDPLSEKFAELIDVQLLEAKRQYQLGEAAYASNLNLSISVLLIALLIGLAQVFYFIRLMSRQLGAEPGELEEISAHIAEGRLGGKTLGNQVMTGVMKSVQSMRRGLQDMIGNIGEASEQIECATLQLAASSEQVLTSANVQSDTASAMAATVEQLAVSINHIAENAQQTYDMAKKAGDMTDAGISVMARATTEMHKIAELVAESSQDVETLAAQSRNISAIVDVIRGIAEQTNLLALNAAIEAARAGEQGRGFAVVADEVRSLAGRTAHSTTEIIALVDAIHSGMHKAKNSMAAGCERVSIGTQLVDQAGSSMTGIRQALNESLQAVSVISLSLQEQRAASEQVAMSVERVAQIVEENSAAQGGIVQAIQSLQAMSGRLQGVMRRFSF